MLAVVFCLFPPPLPPPLSLFLACLLACLSACYLHWFSHPAHVTRIQRGYSCGYSNGWAGIWMCHLRWRGERKRKNRRRQSDLLLEVDDLLRVSPYCAFRRAYHRMRQCITVLQGTVGHDWSRQITRLCRLIGLEESGCAGKRILKLTSNPSLFNCPQGNYRWRKIPLRAMGTQEKRLRACWYLFLLLVCLQSSEMWNLFCWTQMYLPS